MANLQIEAKWVNGIYQFETTDPVIGGADGIDNLQAKQLGCRTEWLKEKSEQADKKIKNLEADYAPLKSPHLTGVPTAPTASQNTNNTQIANTAFVKTAIANLVGSAPASLDTLAELAQALGGDNKLKERLLNLIGQKATQSDFLNLKNLLIGIPFPYPLAQVPNNCLAFNGQAFNKSAYPELAKKYPSGRLPDLRGRFIRGVGGNSAGLLVDQGDAIRNIYGRIEHMPQQDEFGFYPYGVFSYDTMNTNADKIVQGSGSFIKKRLTFNASSVVPTANENRPINMAFNYICLAR